MTDAEKRLWSKIRDRQISNHQFRKQVPLGPFVVDFCCLKARLIIEVDGGQHDINALKDAQRIKWLEAQGYRVLRFWNSDVLANIEGVVEVIVQAFESEPSDAVTDPHPCPPPYRWRGK